MFEAAKFFQKSFFMESALQSLYQRERDSGLKKIPSEEKRLLYAALRHALPLSYYLDQVYPKWRKKKNSLLGISFLFLALEEQIFGQKALYHTYQWINKGLTSSRTDWLKPIARSLLDSTPKGKDDFYQIIDKNIRSNRYIAKILAHYPGFLWPELFEHPPLWIRGQNQEAIQKIASQDIIERRGLAVQLRHTSEVTSELFQGGLISFQNLASQTLSIVLQALYIQHNFSPSRIIDACAAPGGKSLLLLDQYFSQKAFIKWLFTDIHSHKVEALFKNIERIYPHCSKIFPGLKMKVHNWAEKADLEKADLILVDAPCSGSGVTRKHPDALWNGLFEKAKDLAATQYNITKNAVQSLANQGILVYTTCSIDPEENDDVVSKILQNFPALEIIFCDLSEGVKTAYGYQFLPTSAYDGLYISILRKTQS
jgi:16S rRNA C967 or C1407 C5-methylase (RsmB/RsmF family)